MKQLKIVTRVALLLCVAHICIASYLGGEITGTKNLTKEDSPYIVTKDIVVNQDATLTIEPGTKVQFAAGVGLKVNGLLVAQGTASERITFKKIETNETTGDIDKINGSVPYSPGIRLADGPNYRVGRLEIYINGIWGTVCDDGWGIQDTKVACRQLGFLGAKRQYTHGGGLGTIWLDDVNCRGSERNLLKCGHRGIGSSNCGHGEDIGIECHTLQVLVASKRLWKGIEYTKLATKLPNNAIPTLRFVDIIKAFTGVKGNKALPVFHNVTIKDSAYGIKSESLEKPLTITDSVLTGNLMRGIDVTTRHMSVRIDNSHVNNTTYGNGFEYKRMKVDPVELLNVNTSSVSYPLSLSATGKPGAREDTTKIFKTSQGSQLTLHFQSFIGNGYSLEVRDGDTINNTILASVTQTDNGQAVMAAVTTGHALWVRFRYTGNIATTLKLIITDSGDTTSLIISNSKFSDNQAAALMMSDVISRIEITNTDFNRNSVAGVTAERIAGPMTARNIKFINNTGTGLKIYDSSISDCSFSDVKAIGNRESGMSFQITSLRCNFTRLWLTKNTADGLTGSRVAGIIHAVNVSASYNHGSGVKFYDSSISDCSFSDVKAIGNRESGMSFQITSLLCNFTRLWLTKNTADGLTGSRVSGIIHAVNVSASDNHGSGVRFYDGPESVQFFSSRLSRNKVDGCSIWNQGGNLDFEDCLIKENSRHGVYVSDIQSTSNIPRRQLLRFSVKNSEVNDNLQNGIRLMPACQYISSYTENVSIIVVNSDISNNTAGGMRLAPDSCSWNSGQLRHRRVTAFLQRNHFTANKKYALFSSCTAFYRLRAEILNNTFQNSSGQVISIIDESKFYPRRYNNPVEVNIIQNSFFNNKGDNVIYIDFAGFPQVRTANVMHNVFEGNQGHVTFPKLFRRSTNRGVVVFKEGTFTVQRNIFKENNHKLLTTSFFNHTSVINAKFNWWDTAEECEIKDTIFDFHDRVQLAQVDYFPYLLSANTSDHVYEDHFRKSCFLRGGTIGGGLDRELVLPSNYSMYKVRDDVLILPNGSLKIPSNTTLVFRPRSAFLVQGELQVRGKEEQKVRFAMEEYDGNVRLVGGAGPWEGRVEIFHNHTWMSVCLGYRGFSTEGNILCQQLGFERYLRYSNVYQSGKENYFINNLRCDPSKEDITKCNNDKWSYGHSCTGYVAHVYCQRNYWTGLHLAMSNNKSEIHHLEISEAGYPYRADISLPGVAFRVDYDHHNFNNIKINSSAGIGVQVIYSSPFLNKSLMPNSTVSMTASHGVWVGSPYMSFTESKVSTTKGIGFTFNSYWDASYAHVPYISSPDTYIIKNICNGNRTYIEKEKVSYLSSEFSTSPAVSCDHVFVTDPGYKIAFQVIHSSFQYRTYLHAYDNGTVESSRMWKIETFTWNNRQVFNSSTESLVFRFNKLNGYAASFHLMLFSVPENVNPTKSHIEIQNTVFNMNEQGGIQIQGKWLEWVKIRSSNVFNSNNFGISITSSRLTSGTITLCVLEKNKKGITMNGFSGYFEVLNSSINGSTENGIWVQSDGAKTLRVLNSSITHSGDRGLRINGHHMRLRTLIQNSTFAFNRKGAVHFYVVYNTQRTEVALVSNMLRRNFGPVVEIARGNPLTEWTFTSNTFIDNTGFAVIACGSTQHGMCLMRIKDNQFISNHCKEKAVIDIRLLTRDLKVSGNGFRTKEGPVVEIARGNPLTEWIFTSNTFIDNTGFAVIACGSTHHGMSLMRIKDNQFISNHCKEKAVIDIRLLTRNLEVSGNGFRTNEGTVILLEGSAVTGPVDIVDNIFEENNCMNRGVITALRLEEDINIANNTFVRNKGRNIIILQSVHNIPKSPKKLYLINNTFLDNKHTNSVHFDSCVLKISGILQYKVPKFSYNKFINPDFGKELCLAVPSRSQKNSLKVGYNWWGTTKDSEIREKILDFDDNYDFAIADPLPFLLNERDFDAVSFGESSGGLKGSKIGGRLYKSLTLSEEGSPFDVTFDLTILPNVTLKIEPNVELRFSPGTGMLVLGTLKAKGTMSKQIKFTLSKLQTSSSFKIPIRLQDGTYPWQGRLEVFHQNLWMPVCWPRKGWTNQNTDVICRQLGYGSTLGKNHGLSKFGFGPSEAWPYHLRCHDNETSLNSCQVSEKLTSCNTTEYVGIQCEAKPWGNVRFVSPNENSQYPQEQSILEHVHFTYCGKHFNANVSAIETVFSTPKLNAIHIRNCTSDGFRSLLPTDNILVNGSNFSHLGGDGLILLQNNKKITVQNSSIRNNRDGVVFDEPHHENVPSVHYGRVMICDTISTVTVNDKMLVYFDIPQLVSVASSATCQKLIQVPKGKGVRIRLLFYKGTQRVRLFSNTRGTMLVDMHSNGNRLQMLVLKDLVVLRDRALLWWSGDVNCKVMFEVEAVDLKNSSIPCTFDDDLCSWQTFSNMSINGVNMTTTWRTTNDRSTYQAGTDNSYYSREGKLLYIGNTRWPSKTGRASIVSPVISRKSRVCTLVFYYRFGRSGKASLALFLQRGTNIFSPSAELIPFWKPQAAEVLGWTKVVLDLPLDLGDFRLVFVGFFNVTTNYYSRNFVTLDDLQFLSCIEVNHQLLNNVIHENRGCAIKYRSITNTRDTLNIHRCTITNNGISGIRSPPGAIAIEMKDRYFQLSNNYIAGNSVGGVYAKLSTSDGKRSKKCLVYSNTFLSNGKETVFFEASDGLALDAVQMRNNVFSSNYGKDGGNVKHSIVKVTDVVTNIEGNFFYNNSGLYIVEYKFSSKDYKNQRCENNTFYLNYGTASDYGATIRTNGPMVYHRNNFKNPYNLYEFDTTLSAVSDPVNASLNWFGFGLKPTVMSRIRDNEDDYRLPVVVFKPYLKIQPRNLLSFGCPPEWMNLGSSCYVFRPGAQSFADADRYCKYYGGHILSSFTPGNKELLLIRMASKRPDGMPQVSMWVLGEELEQKENPAAAKKCEVFTHDGKLQTKPCNSHFPFTCSRSAVIRCPNGCLHNGDCIGATCFCYPGWTGPDCSQFHCRDVHDCSGYGKCVGPNVCKCMSGFQGRGCTYSYCSKFKRCTTCSTDPNCGWCDSMQLCMPGNQSRPHQESCPSWFYYNCYTVGGDNYCSSKIQRVDCQGKQCNFTRVETTKTSCRKCRDLERCYNNEEKGQCRSWNVTKCPYGLVKVDYSDKNRINSTQLRKDVTVIDPNTTTIYNCPVVLPGQDEITSVFIVPRRLGLKVGQVMTSKQAGGVMHRINETEHQGPYTIIYAKPAKIEEVVEYADFTEKVDPEPLIDEVTEEDPPNRQDIDGLIYGDIKLDNNITMHALPWDKYVYKCLGHMYKIDDEYIVSHYLVMDASSSLQARTGDVIVARESYGFLEKVTYIKSTEAAMFLHTRLERCDGNSTWNTKFKPRRPSSPEDDDVICTGGDNNPGLLITEPDVEANKISINDTIIGRRSQPFIAKVISSQTNGDYIVMEVLTVKAIMNGTAVTEVELNLLHVHHRRTRRDIDRTRFRLSNRHQRSLKIPFLAGYVSIQETFKVSANFIVSIGVFSHRDSNGDLKVTDAVFGLEMYGEMVFKVDLQLGVEKSLFVRQRGIPIVRPVQIGLDLCIPIPPGICIPSAFFFELNIDEVIKINAKAYVPISYTSTARLGLGGLCSFSSGCTITRSQRSFNQRFSNNRIQVEGDVTWENMLVPRLTYMLPTVPRLLRSLINTFVKIGQKIFKKFPGFKLGSSSSGSVSILKLTLEMPYGLKVTLKPCSNKCEKKSNAKTELSLNYGFSEIVGKLIVGFGTKNRELGVINSKVYGGLERSACIDCGRSWCDCPTTPPPTTTATPTDTTTSISTKETSTTQPTTGSTTPFTRSTTPFTGITTSISTKVTSTTQPTTGSTTPYTGTVTPGTENTTPYTGSMTPFTGSTTLFTESTTPFTGSTTPPPTTAPPCKCEDGKTGVRAPDGECDCPPECKDGKKPKLVNNKYECPDHPPCGENPSCVTGRKGEGCSQPDVTPCDSGCYGNGISVALGDCQSKCNCFRRWTGKCCETRLPWRNWGDPHIETLDGIEFDYFGIGEFWGCRSYYNDFGLQFRYFAYERASLTGGVAVKAGRSVVTVMTVKTLNPLDMPKLRINGVLTNLTNSSGQQIQLENSTVLLDVQRRLNSQGDEGAIVLVSLQFQSGLTVTVDVRHSSVMGRQYLNALFTPTSAFRGHTQGLCGIMDNNPANDLTGSRGEVYTNPIKFADSWRISSTHNDSGLYGSWSWSASNFHADDVMDLSYTDPKFVPVYGLSGISDQALKKAKSICESRALTGNLLKNCIYDLVITNDSSMAGQETLKKDCPNQCSGKGRCVNETCQCMEGWSGPSCEIGQCANCSVHGKCVKGFCQCDVGWEGRTCENKATCHGVKNCTSPLHGVCKTTDQCLCKDGFIGKDCSIVPTCLNVSSCSGRGICVDYDVCKCNKDWIGKDCTQNSCADLDFCSGRGRCVNVYKCECNPGWSGISCAVPDCAGVNQCSGHGDCVSTDKCQCYPEYQGGDCSETADCSMLSNCSKHGACVKETGVNASCRCYHGFSGPECKQASCYEVSNCSSHGVCQEAGFCKCNIGFTGPDCANVSCEAVNYCSGHGECIAYDECRCQSLWNGAACSVPDCTAVKDCSKQGVCMFPNKCECYPGYDGSYCDQKATPNLNAPVFESAFYNASVYENSELGTFVVQVNATDVDSGRNGNVMYFLERNDADGAFTIDGTSGKITTSSALDYEAFPKKHLFTINVKVSDNGTPPKFASTKVDINMLDTNDNCPVFDPSLETSYNMSVYADIGTEFGKVITADKDVGTNGYVTYSITSSGTFAIDPVSGQLSVIGEVKPQEYRVIIIARDQGVPPCSSVLKLTIRGARVQTSPRITTETSTPDLTTRHSTTQPPEPPVESTQSSFFDNPIAIAGISIGGLIVLAIVVIILVRIRLRKPSPLIRGSRLGILYGSRGKVYPEVQVQDLEIEDAEEGLRKGTETIELHQLNATMIDF